MDEPTEDITSQRPNLQRRRTAYACVSCRTRKSRCDGHDPCGTCRQLGNECHYDHATGSTKAKSDLILNAILRLEGSISSIDRKVSGLQQDFNLLAYQQPNQHFSPAFAGATPGHLSTPGTHTFDDNSSRARSHISHDGHLNQEFNNAIISADHTSTTEAILHWPVFNAFPDLRREDVVKSGAIFLMENSRQRQISHEQVMPFLSEDEVDKLIGAFQRTINFSYPIVSQATLHSIRDQYCMHEMDFSTRTCSTLLVLALGCAAEIVSEANGSNPCDTRKLVRLRTLGRIYFDAALSRLFAAYSTINVESTQCLALTALYYAYLQRPIQAWSMLSSTATACRVMLAYSSNIPDQAECLRRIFWTCYILESDYLAELPALPQFGIGEIESSIPLPGHFTTYDDLVQNELSDLYFTACISMRRLLNRCHHLLFGDDNNKRKHSRNLSTVVSELDQQLEDWKRLLPPHLNFNIDTEPTDSQHAGFLRQRYLTCRALIYRPYIMDAISNHATGKPSDHNVVDGASQCLEASLLHVLNLRPFHQTVLIDMWICSLSMAGTMMVLLVAASTDLLRLRLSDQIYLAGPHLLSLLGTYADIHGESRSPSVSQAIEWIKIIDQILQRGYESFGHQISPAYTVH